MSQIPLGDFLQFAGTSVGIALSFQALLFGLSEYVWRKKMTNMERTPFKIPLLMLVDKYHYAGLCALPWFLSSLFACLLCHTFGIAHSLMVFFLYVGWLIIIVMVFDMILEGLKDLADEPPDGKIVQFFTSFFRTRAQ